MKSSSLASLLHALFHEWMGHQRNLSRHTVCSYRDSWKLFLRFASERTRRQITKLSLADLQASEVLAFLEHLEKERKVSISTRNCRLAAIHSFFTFRSPDLQDFLTTPIRTPAADQCREIPSRWH